MFARGAFTDDRPGGKRAVASVMSGGKRLSICYAAPGLNLLPTSGPTRNVLSVAEALGQWADVTVAFRHIFEPIETQAFRAIAIDPSPPLTGTRRDDTATRGLHPIRHLVYCRTLQRFAQRHAGAYHVVLEKGWRLSGFLSAAFVRAGVPSAVVENAVSLWLEPVAGLEGVGKYLLHRSADALTNRSLRQVPMVIAETDELKAMLIAHRGVDAERIHVVRLGLDHRRFRPMPQHLAREELGVSQDAVVFVYVGGIDEYHDLEPIIDAMAEAAPAVQLHVVGDGEFRQRLEQRAAAACVRARFHGHVPHDMVPRYIAAADLCLAPYRTSAFHGGVVTFATLKIPEYMACARPVVSVPSPAIERLIAHGVNGFVFPNDRGSWTTFLKALPTRERLTAMGRAAADAVRPITWEATAREYFSLCQQLVARENRPVRRGI